MRHERHPGNTASEVAFRQEDKPTGPSRGPTVKDFLTVEPVRNAYQFESGGEQRRQLEASQPVSDFDRTVEQIKKLGAPKPKRVRKGKNPADGKELGYGE